MPIDSSIALQYRGPQIESPVAQYGNVLAIQNAQNQNRLADLQYQTAQRGIEEKNALAEAYRGAIGADGQIDRNALLTRLAGGSAASQIPSVQKGFLESDKTSAEIGKIAIENGVKVMGLYREKLADVNSPETAAQWLMAQYSDPNLGPIMRRLGPPEKALAGIPQDPAGLEQWRMRNAMGMEKFITANAPQRFSQNDGQTVNEMTFRPLTGEVGTISSRQMQTTPDAMLTDTRTREEGDKNRGVQIRGQNLVNARAGEANTINSGKGAREDADNLRKEFEGREAVKSYRAVIPIAEAARKAPDTRAGDIQLAYAVGKILDPNSVVREGELALVGNAATLPEKIQGQIRTLVMGKGRMTPETRKEIQKILDNAVGERKSAYDAERQSVEQIVGRRGYNPQDVFVSLPAGGQQQPQAATKVLNGRRYVQRNGQWFDEGAAQ